MTMDRTKILAKGRLKGAMANRCKAERRREVWGRVARRILLPRPHLLGSLPKLAQLVAQHCEKNGIEPASARVIYGYLISNQRAALREPKEKFIPLGEGRKKSSQ